MEKKNNKVKKIIALSCLLGALSYYFYEPDYHLDYGVCEEEGYPFGEYSKGYIYIGDYNYINSVRDRVTPNDILICLGMRLESDYDDPNAKIYSSYRITDPKDRLEILNVLYLYGEYHHIPWERTIESMRIEWTVHNILYDLNYKRNRTKDVDLNNLDEKRYSNKILQRLIK